MNSGHNIRYFKVLRLLLGILTVCFFIGALFIGVITNPDEFKSTGALFNISMLIAMIVALAAYLYFLMFRMFQEFNKPRSFKHISLSVLLISIVSMSFGHMYIA